MDTSAFKILTLEENPARHEAIIAAQQARYATDPGIRQLLDSIYLEADRARAFDRFLNGLEFQTIVKLLGMFRVTAASRLCEVGGGPGFLSWALTRAGFDRVELLEPNAEFNTGTGYLRTRSDATGITIHNDLPSWHATAEAYDAVITKNCIHHFKNISQAAASLRQKMHDGALWFAFREWYADSPRELYGQLAGHPYCQPYGLYEWPYPAHHYVEAIEIAGFRLAAVVPAGYTNNCLAAYVEQEGDEANRQMTAQIEAALTGNPGATVQAFWQEVIGNRFQGKQARLFSRPQLMVFARVPV